MTALQIARSLDLLLDQRSFLIFYSGLMIGVIVGSVT